MNCEAIVAMAVMGICCFGTGVLCCSIAAMGKDSPKPMNFWAGETVDPGTVSDIVGYNMECAQLWNHYSMPYFLAGVLSCLNWLHEGFLMAAACILFLAGTVGIWLLIRQYRKIERKYIQK